MLLFCLVGNLAPIGLIGPPMTFPNMGGYGKQQPPPPPPPPPEGLLIDTI